MRILTTAVVVLAFLTAFTALRGQDPRSSRVSAVPLRHEPKVVVSRLEVLLQADGPGVLIESTITLLNRTESTQEFDFIFPLGQDGVLTDITLRSGEQILEGRVYSRDEARALYQQITRKERDPALLEHYGEGMYRARVAPIPAKATQTLVLTYRSIPRPVQGLPQIRVPLTAWRRLAAPMDVIIRGKLASDHPITSLYSPTHELKLPRFEVREGVSNRFRAEFTCEIQATTPETDFLLTYQSRPRDRGFEGIDLAVLSDRPNPQEAGYFVAVLSGMPFLQEKPERKDVVFVIDRSGSMRGPKMDQAKAALKFLVERLNPEDRFNVVAYSSQVELFSPALMKPGEQSLLTTLPMIAALEANGGTNIEEALASALAQLSGSDRLSQIVFITDGLPTVGETNDRVICKNVRAKNGTRTRIVAFGVGFDVNGTFLDRLAVENHGMSEFILPSENLEERIPDFYTRIQAPIAIDLTLTCPKGSLLDVYPKSVPDLYQGQQVVITGRAAQSGSVEFVLTGTRRGEAFEKRFEANLSAAAGDHIVPRIWAGKKVGYLIDEIRLGGPNPELVQSIIELGTRYGILTEYTSFLAAPTADPTQVEEMKTLGILEFENRSRVESGGQGVAQAANSKKMQRADSATTGNSWLDHQGKVVEIKTVLNIGPQTLFFRGDTWIPATIASEVKPDVDMGLFSDETFALMDRTPGLNRCLARAADLILEVEGRVIHFKPMP